MSVMLLELKKRGSRVVTEHRQLEGSTGSTFFPHGPRPDQVANRASSPQRGDSSDATSCTSPPVRRFSVPARLESLLTMLLANPREAT